MTRRRCNGTNGHNEPCQQAPLIDADLCFWHDPKHAAEAAEARRLGGLRRRREHTVAGAYEFQGLETVAGLRRVLEIAAFDALGLENSVGRVRALTSIVQVGGKLLEVGELAERLAAVEQVLGPRLKMVRR